MEPKTFFNSKNRAIGTLKEGIFRKKIHGTIHIMRMFGGSIGIDSSVVDNLGRAGCKEIRVLDQETNVIYSAEFDVFQKNCISKTFDGEQCFLPLRWWNKKDPNQTTLNDQEQPTDTA